MCPSPSNTHTTNTHSHTHCRRHPPARLYSSAHYNDTFPQHTPPEIRNAPLEGVVLSLKALGVDKPRGFPFPTPPEPEALAAAERCLLALAGGPLRGGPERGTGQVWAHVGAGC
jgi:HrpA-like RNA helicase